MIFFGWGRRNKTQQTSPNEALVLGFSYFHIFWLFRVSFGLNYSLAALTDVGWATRPLSALEATSIGATNALTLHWWWRFGLLIAISAIVVVGMLSSIS